MTTSTHAALVDKFRGLGDDALRELRDQVADVLPDLAAAVGDIGAGSWERAGRQLVVTVASLRSRLTAIDEAMATNIVAVQTN